jgi:hypothetical protein
MSNTINGRVLNLDTIGVIKSTAFTLKKAVLFPNAAADAATFYSWNELVAAKSTKTAGATTVTGTNTITCVGAFTTAKVAVGDIIKITASSTGNNIGAALVLTRSTDDAIVITGAALTNDTAATYNFSIWTPTLEFTLKANKTTATQETLISDFAGGRKFWNLVLASISASAVTELILE